MYTPSTYTRHPKKGTKQKCALVNPLQKKTATAAIPTAAEDDRRVVVLLPPSITEQSFPEQRVDPAPLLLPLVGWLFVAVTSLPFAASLLPLPSVPSSQLIRPPPLQSISHFPLAVQKKLQPSSPNSPSLPPQTSPHCLPAHLSSTLSVVDPADPSLAVHDAVYVDHSFQKQTFIDKSASMLSSAGSSNAAIDAQASGVSGELQNTGTGTNPSLPFAAAT